jgi:hypothetical protein
LWQWSILRRLQRNNFCNAWIAEHRSIIEGFWGEQTIPARAAVSERQRSIEATPYVALPLRIGNPSSGTLISQPTSDEIAKLISEKRTVIQVIGPGGLGKPPSRASAVSGLGWVNKAASQCQAFIKSDLIKHDCP